MSTLADLSAPLSHLSTLRQNVYNARKRYWECEFGDSYREYEVLKNARKEYSSKCVAFVEQMIDDACNKTENISIETRILLEKMNEQLV